MAKQATKETNKEIQKSGNGSVKTKGKGISLFIIETRQEISKVTWPDRKLVIRATIIILCMVVFATLFISGLDVLFSSVLVNLSR